MLSQFAGLMVEQGSILGGNHFNAVKQFVLVHQSMLNAMIEPEFEAVAVSFLENGRYHDRHRVDSI